MYHRVLPIGIADGIQPGMYVEPETFEAHLRFVKKHFRIVSLSNLSSNVESHRSNSNPVCLLTFDDGYYDLYEYAFPILKTYSLPATVFLPTDFIGTKKLFWTDRLSAIFYQKQREEKKGGGAGHRVLSNKPAREIPLNESFLPPPMKNKLVNQIENLNGSEESRLEKAIKILKKYRDEKIEEVLAELSTRWNLNPERSERAFLSWEEVREMAQSGLISFGSHTASHRILTTLADEEIWDELTRSKEKLVAEKVVDPSFIPFCYPNGNYNEKIAEMVKEAGYILAVTTKKGWNRFDSDPFTLKRIGIHQDMTSTEAMFECRIAGIY